MHEYFDHIPGIVNIEKIFLKNQLFLLTLRCRHLKHVSSVNENALNLIKFRINIEKKHISMEPY